MGSEFDKSLFFSLLFPGWPDGFFVPARLRKTHAFNITLFDADCAAALVILGERRYNLPMQ
jgi:hypothetical protein